MNKRVTIFIISGVIAVTLFIMVSALNTYKFDSLKIDEYLELYKDNNSHLVLIKENKKTAVKEFTNVLKVIAKEKNLEIKELNLSKLTDAEKTKFIEANPITESEYTIPALIYIKEGKIVDMLSGYNTKDEVKQFLIKNEVITNE